VTGGFAQVPNSVIENLRVFTPAELALTLMVLRREAGAPITDKTWQSWTGLSPRAKEYAVAGLRKKCLHVEGRGDQMRFAFEPNSWERFVRTVDRGDAARTEGRKAAVAPKPGAKVHPDCRARGCAMLTSDSGQIPTNGGMPSGRADVTYISGGPVESTASEANAQPVAQTPAPELQPSAAKSEAAPPPRNEVSTGETERGWPKTLAALRMFFPVVAAIYIQRLLAVILESAPGDPLPSDELLSEAVHAAGQRKKRYQTDPGLFMHTVPEQLALLKRRPPRPPPGEGPRLTDRELEELQVLIDDPSTPETHREAFLELIADERRKRGGAT
jgi:hypothetical protein